MQGVNSRVRSLVVAAGILLATLSGGAQQMTTVLQTVPQQQRQGVIVTSSFTLPAGVTAGEVQAVLNIPTVDYEDPANRVLADLYMLDGTVPGGWRLLASNRNRDPNNPDLGGWQGGNGLGLPGPFVDEDGITNPPPIVFSLTVTEVTRGRTFRAEFDVPNRMRVGLAVQWILP